LKRTKVLLTLLSVTAILLPLVTVCDIGKAMVTGNYWYETWLNYKHYQLDLGGPENASYAVTLRGVQDPSYKIETSLDVSVYEYDMYGPVDDVLFRVALYFNSSAPPGFDVTTQADDVCLAIHKDVQGCNLDQQSILFEDRADSLPGFSQGYRLAKPVQMESDPIERATWALPALSFAINLFKSNKLRYVNIALTLIDLATSRLPTGEDHENADRQETWAWSSWHNPYGGDPISQDPINQYCFDTVRWDMYRIEPSSYNGLIVDALVTLSPDARQIFGVGSIYVGPIHLRLYNEDEMGGGEGCPTLFAWNGKDYSDYGVINIHNPSGEDVVREVSVLSNDVSVEDYRARFTLREGWPRLNFSESVIDQVKLYAIDSYGNRYPCPLVDARHSRLGNVLPQLIRSDDWRTQILLLETIELTFVVPYENVHSYVFRIEGCNRYKQ
jgi:hypothetical protein